MTGLANSLVTIGGGLTACYGSGIVNKIHVKPINIKLVLFTGWVGLAVFVEGIFEVYCSLKSISWLNETPVIWVGGLCCGVADLFIGFVMGSGLIVIYSSQKNEAANARVNQAFLELWRYQIILGISALIIGIFYLPSCVILEYQLLSYFRISITT